MSLKDVDSTQRCDTGIAGDSLVTAGISALLVKKNCQIDCRENLLKLEGISILSSPSEGKP